LYIWASLARHARTARFSRVLCVFFMVQFLLTVPVAVAVFREPPSVMYPRMHGGPDWALFSREWADVIQVTADERGFAQGLYTPAAGHENWHIDTGSAAQGNLTRIVFAPRYDAWADTSANYLFVFTPEYIFYRDARTALALPLHMVSAWAVQAGDLEEIFNHLALHNRYFSGVVAPMLAMVFIVFMFSQGVIYLAAVWLFGHWQKFSGYMTARERFSVCVFAAVPAGLISMAIGIFVPMLYAFLFPFIMLLFAYKALKEYWNADVQQLV